MQAPAPCVRTSSSARAVIAASVVVLAFLRLAHIRVLWADEDFHIAASLNLLHGRVPYRDFIYDKPPLSACFYLLIGGHAGWPLRLLDAAYVLLVCYLAYRLARFWWGEAEGQIAALLLAFFMAFYLPSAVVSFAPDALMMLPHLAAIYFARKKQYLLAGLLAGIGFWINTKALFVLGTCALWAFPAIWVNGRRLLSGFAAVLLAGCLALLSAGAWHDYIDQVWLWGLRYATQPPGTNPLHTGLVLTINWMGFHSALVLAAAFALSRMETGDRWKCAVWIVLSFLAVALGSRFSPRYFLQILPPLVIVASRGITLAWRAYGRSAVAVLALLLLVPLARFGPRYFMLALDNLQHREPAWADVALDVDNRRAATRIRALSHPGDTLFVWGLRSSIYVYSRMISDSRFWDSEPLTGVPGDRHLTAAAPIDIGPAAQYRTELSQSQPTFLVDGLGLLNPRLAPERYPELLSWLRKYKLIGRTGSTLIYQRIP